MNLGADVLGLLPKITPNTSAESKERLGRVRRALETKVAESVTKPKLVTLEGSMSVAEAFQKLGALTGNKVLGFDDRGGNVTLDFKDTLYWEALDQLLDKAGLNVREYSERNTLTVSARPDEGTARHGDASYSGVFRFECTRVEAARDVRNPQLAGLKLQLEVTWEPRVTPVSLAQSFEQLEIQTDNDESLEVAGQRMFEVPTILGASNMNITIPLSLPDRDVRKIKSLKGEITATIPVA